MASKAVGETSRPQRTRERKTTAELLDDDANLLHLRTSKRQKATDNPRVRRGRGLCDLAARDLAFAAGYESRRGGRTCRIGA
jgi:hypothetical protein